MKIFLGDKFYRYIEETDTVEIIRISKIKNENSFSYVTVDNTKGTITKSELLDSYTKLKSDATIAFTIVNLQDDMKDVIVAMYRTNDLENGVNLPYAVCRQNIFDLFTNQVQKGKTMYFGVSVSVDTIPEDVPFEMTLACNGLVYDNKISVYMDDTLETILSFVNTGKFDAVLNSIYTKVSNSEIKGYCNSLEQLLLENDFMYDFLRAFDIHRVDFELETQENGELDVNQRIIIEEMLKVEMFRTYVLEYDKEINLKEIKRNYILVSDKNNKLFIVGYDKGEYINRAYVQNIKDKRDAVAMLRYKKLNK